MLPVIRNQITESKAILVRNTVEYPVFLGNVPKPIHDPFHHSLVPFQEPAHDRLKFSPVNHNLRLL